MTETSTDRDVSAFSLGMDHLAVDVGQMKPIDPSTFTVARGSTVQHGSSTFRNRVDTLSPAGAKRLAGSVAWACAGS